VLAGGLTRAFGLGPRPVACAAVVVVRLAGVVVVVRLACAVRVRWPVLGAVVIS